jgi:hypothetical protein
MASGSARAYLVQELRVLAAEGHGHDGGLARLEGVVDGPLEGHQHLRVGGGASAVERLDRNDRRLLGDAKGRASGGGRGMRAMTVAEVPPLHVLLGDLSAVQPRVAARRLRARRAPSRVASDRPAAKILVVQVNARVQVVQPRAPTCGIAISIDVVAKGGRVHAVRALRPTNSAMPRRRRVGEGVPRARAALESKDVFEHIVVRTQFHRSGEERLRLLTPPPSFTTWSASCAASESEGRAGTMRGFEGNSRRTMQSACTPIACSSSNCTRAHNRLHFVRRGWRDAACGPRALRSTFPVHARRHRANLCSAWQRRSAQPSRSGGEARPRRESGHEAFPCTRAGARPRAA